VKPFLDSIHFLPEESEEVSHGMEALTVAEHCIGAFDADLLMCIRALISDIVFVESKLESEGNIFSFSDDSAPNVLYIAPFAGNKPLEPDDLADSILHEFFHHVLYHAETDGAVLFDKVYPRFPAPWRSGLRPSGGFFHGTFVFAGLSKYWEALTKAVPPLTDYDKAETNAANFRSNTIYGIRSLRSFALLTKRGESLLTALSKDLGASEDNMLPPGIIS